MTAFCRYLVLSDVHFPVIFLTLFKFRTSALDTRVGAIFMWLIFLYKNDTLHYPWHLFKCCFHTSLVSVMEEDSHLSREGAI